MMKMGRSVALRMLGRWHQKVKFGNPCTGRLRRYVACFLAAMCLCANLSQGGTAAYLFRHPSENARRLPTRSPAQYRVKPVIHRSSVARQDSPIGENAVSTNDIVTLNSTNSSTKETDAKLLELGLLDTVSAALGTLPLWKTVGEGESVLLSIGVDLGFLVSLQWYFNDVPIAGANDGSLLITQGGALLPAGDTVGNLPSVHSHRRPN
jgi:hypothetical protein